MRFRKFLRNKEKRHYPHKRRKHFKFNVIYVSMRRRAHKRIIRINKKRFKQRRNIINKIRTLLHISILNKKKKKKQYLKSYYKSSKNPYRNRRTVRIKNKRLLRYR